MAAALNFLSTGSTFGTVAFGGIANVTLNGSGIALAWIVQAETTSPITRIRYRYGSRAATPPTYSITLETVDSSGNPTGTDIGGGSPTLTTFTPPADTTWNSTIRELVLTNPWTPTLASDVFAIVVRYSSGTVDGTNNSSFTRTANGIGSESAHFPLSSSLSGGVWTKGATAPMVAWGTSSKLFGALASVGYTTATANTAGHRSAAYLTIPSGFGSTFKVHGIGFNGKFGAASGSVKIAIWDTAGAVMASCTLDSDLANSPTSATRYVQATFDSVATLNFGEKYYYGIEVVSGTVGIAGLVCDDADLIAALPLGSVSGLATYDGSSWTETATTYVPLVLLYDDITVPSGGGGGPLIMGRLVQ